MRRISISDANEDDIIDAVATFFAHDYGHLFLSIGILAVILLIAVMLNGLGIRQGLVAFNVALFIYAAMKIRREHIVSFNSIFWFISLCLNIDFVQAQFVFVYDTINAVVMNILSDAS